MAIISLSQLFTQAFGFASQAFNGISYRIPPRAETASNGAPYYGTDSLGREYFMPVTLTYPTISPTAISPLSIPVNVPYNLPYPVISISGRKTIIETPLIERRGTVKELINIMDYEITIRGLIIGSTRDFPERDIGYLRDLFEQNISIQIKSALTDIFLIRPDRNASENVVIKELDFPPLSGVKNVKPYLLRMVSDEAFNLIET